MRLILVLTLPALVVAGVPAQQPAAPVPTRLLHDGDLVHAGSFTLPDVRDGAGQDGFTYSHGVIGFNPRSNSLFVVGHDWNQRVAEINIPEIGGVATMRQPFADPIEGRIRQVNPQDPNEQKIGGMLVVDDRLVVSVYSAYDGGGTASTSHFVRPVDLSSTGQVQGPIRVGTIAPGLVAGYFAPIPQAWHTALGGTVLNGQCCLSVLDRTSAGPAAAAVRIPPFPLQGTAAWPASLLVGYPNERHTIGGYESRFSLANAYTGTTSIRGVVLPEGTASVLFIGRQGLGPFCYGTGAQCKDPDVGDSGGHAYPYQAQVWAYRVTDLAAVRTSGRRPWDVKPYAVWRLPGLRGWAVGGAAIDPATGRIFVAENYGDGIKMRIHVFRVRAAT